MTTLKEKKTILPVIFLWLIFWSHCGPAEAERLNINTATAPELTSLPYIGTIRAGIIIDCRQNHGPFEELNELLICEGIGPDTLKAMRADLEVIGGKNGSPAVPRDHKEEAAGRLKTTTGDILILPNSNYFPTLLEKIRAAQNSIDLTMFVFKATDSPKNRASMVVEELRGAARRGVKVRIFLEKSGYDEKLNETNRKTAGKLEGKGIEIFFDSADITTHSKLVVVDRRFSFVGSHNLTHAALTHNNELSLLVDDPGLAQSLTAYMAGIPRR